MWPTFAKRSRTVYDALAAAKGTAMSLEQLKKDVCSAVDDLRAELLSLSHAIHAEPELALEEFKAAKRPTDAVEGHGLAVQRAASGLATGYASEFGTDAGPNVAILSEYD